MKKGRTGRPFGIEDADDPKQKSLRWQIRCRGLHKTFGDKHYILRDLSFGAVMTISLGGIYAERLKEEAFRLPPFGPDEVLDALRDLRAFGLLERAHGRPASDITALTECIARMSWLAVDLQDLISELEVNSLRVLPQGRGVRIIDARVIPRPPDSVS